MDRRSTLKAFSGAAALAALAVNQEAFAQATSTAPQPAARGRERARAGGVPALKITDLKVFRLTVGTRNLFNVKIYTNEPGLYGLGCGTHAVLRGTVIEDIIETYMKPFLIGRDPTQIEKLWQEMYVSPYWRGGMESNNAMAAIDGALWDILGKRCGVPVYDLLGGKVRTGLRCMTSAPGRDLKEMEDSMRKSMADGYMHFRFAPPGPPQRPSPTGDLYPKIDGDAEYIKRLVGAYEHVRKTIGWDVEIGTDVHERNTPRGALMLAKAVEPTRPFFLEDLFSPEDIGWYKILREQSAVGVAMGELFVNVNEWLPLVSNRYIDFVRMHISCGGGLNMARKMAHVCEFFGVQTSWHGPDNLSPVGHAINMHIDLSIYNFGICEGRGDDDLMKELYPGCPEIRKGVRYANDRPGLGVDLDEKVAAKYVTKGKGNGMGIAGAEIGSEGAPWRP